MYFQGIRFVKPHLENRTHLYNLYDEFTILPNGSEGDWWNIIRWKFFHQVFTPEAWSHKWKVIFLSWMLLRRRFVWGVCLFFLKKCILCDFSLVDLLLFVITIRSCSFSSLRVLYARFWDFFFKKLFSWLKVSFCLFIPISTKLHCEKTCLLVFSVYEHYEKFSLINQNIIKILDPSRFSVAWNAPSSAANPQALTKHHKTVDFSRRKP